MEGNYADVVYLGFNLVFHTVSNNRLPVKMKNLEVY